jgi:DNA-binding LacI/PurR family transcriptional regulator
LQRVAARAKVDPRTVKRALLGRRQSDAVRDAIIAALRAEGFEAEARRLEGDAR